jgi:hypothetical protein
MSARAVVLMIIVVFIPLATYAVVRWWRVFNSPDGERYMKRRMQGPFVPLTSEDISSDEERKIQS